MTVYAVSRLRLDKDGRVTTVLWGALIHPSCARTFCVSSAQRRTVAGRAFEGDDFDTFLAYRVV